MSTYDCHCPDAKCCGILEANVVGDVQLHSCLGDYIFGKSTRVGIDLVTALNGGVSGFYK